MYVRPWNAHTFGDIVLCKTGFSSRNFFIKAEMWLKEIFKSLGEISIINIIFVYHNLKSHDYRDWETDRKSVV